MDKLDKYRQIVCQFLEDFAKEDPEAKLIFDLEHDCEASRRHRFLVMHVNWRNDYRIYGCAMHLDLIDEKA